MSPASGDARFIAKKDFWIEFHRVSIQLMSPASGDLEAGFWFIAVVAKPGFHSINVPSEWGHPKRFQYKLVHNSVSIQLMSPASGDPHIQDEQG
jgi:hypothetical protein